MALSDSLWIVVDSAHFGGIESHIFQLSMGLHRQNVAVRVIFLNDYSDTHGTHPLDIKLQACGVATTTLDGRFTSLKRLINKHRPSLCHAHGYKAGIYSRFAGIITNTPCITTYHAGERCKGKLGFYDFFDRSTAIFNTCSTAVSDLISQKVYAPCEQMNNFIDTAGLVKSEGNSIGFVGRLSEEKGPEAFTRLAAHFPNEQFNLFGDGPLRAMLTKAASDNCFIRGHVEMNDHWSELKLLVICSTFEGLPLCLLEAMARGVIVIAYDLGQISHVIEDQRNGYLVPKGDFVSLKECLQSVLSLTDEERSIISRHAQSTIANHYSTDTVLPKYLSLYHKYAHFESNNMRPTSSDGDIQCVHTKKPLTILFVHYGENWIRGSEICLINLVSNIRNHGVKPVVWCNSQILCAELERRNIEVVKQHFTILLGWEKPRLDILNFAALIKSANCLIEKHQVDVIHTNGGAPNQWMLISARKTSTPIITQLHAPYLLRDRISLSLRDPDIVVGVSKAVIEPFIKDTGVTQTSKFKVIHNGIDLSPYDPNSRVRTPAFDLRKALNISKNAYLIISVGSLIDRKGFDLLIQAIALMRNRNVNAELIIIGDGDKRSDLHAMSETLNISNYIHFLGERKDVSSLLQSDVDVYASGARDEAFGLVLAEAGAAGLASVAPSVGGIPEVIEHAKSGLLVKPNSANDIAHALHSLYIFPNNREQMGLYAQSLVMTKFGLEENTCQFHKLYTTLKQNTQTQHWRSKFKAYLSPFISLTKYSVTRRC